MVSDTRLEHYMFSTGCRYFNTKIAGNLLNHLPKMIQLVTSTVEMAGQSGGLSCRYQRY